MKKLLLAVVAIALIGGVAFAGDGSNGEIKAKAGGNGRLFGSVTNTDIAKAIKETSGLTVDKRKIEISESINNIGSFAAKVRFSKDITADIKILVSAI